MISKIKCNQEKCKYNSCEHCMLNSIQVDENANCKSYKEGQNKNNSNFEFASFEGLTNKIKCNASECIYNQNKNCIVDNLNIGKAACAAPCKDFKKNN